ncbi:hypothetical protein [Rhizobium sp.]
MYRTVTNIVPRIFTRRALVGVIQSHQQEQPGDKPADIAGPHMPSARRSSAFPLSLTVGLMTIGVIAIVSLLQLLVSWLG